MTLYTRAVRTLVAAILLPPMVTAQGQGGGNVNNLLPTVESFSNLGSPQNDASVDVASLTVRDRNGESDVLTLRVRTTAGPSVSSERTITAADIAAATEPAAYDANGWKVWNAVNRDGRLQAKFQYTYPTGQAANYTWEASVKDESAYQTGPAGAIWVQVKVRIMVASSPQTAAGTPSSDGFWGGWSATPGQANVESTTYVKVTNTGAKANQSFTVDFTSTSFTGAADPSFAIPIDGNVQFAYWEDVTPADNSPPSSGSYTYGAAASFGSATFQFTGFDHVIFIKYRIATLPDPLYDQSYSASYLVSPG